jgi:HEAT repeat protein
MMELLSRKRLETHHFDMIRSNKTYEFEVDGWWYRITVTLEAVGPQRAPTPASVTITRIRGGDEFMHTVAPGRDDRRHFAELVFLLASKLKYDQLRGISSDGAGFLHSREIVRLNEDGRTKVPKSVYSSIGVLYRQARKEGTGERDFLHALFTRPEQMWHLIYRCGVTAGTADKVNLVWWLNVRPDAVVFRHASGDPVDDDQLKKLLGKLFRKKCLLNPAEYQAFATRLDLGSPSRARMQREIHAVSETGQPSQTDHEETRTCSDQAVLGPFGRPTLKDEVLRYLDDLAADCGELRYYFPPHLKGDGSGKSAFDTLRQVVRVAEDYRTLHKGLEESERLHQTGVDPDPVGWTELGDEYSQHTIAWDERAGSHFSQVTILGGPGSGKSWLLRYEAEQAAHRAIDRLESGAISDVCEIELPIRVRLTDLARRRGTLRKTIVMLAGQNRSGGFKQYVRQQLKLHRAVLLLDAWDEVLDTNRIMPLYRHIQDFAQVYQGRILLTSRLAGYELTQPPLLRSKEVELLPWNWSQIQSFAAIWFGEDTQQTTLFLTKLREHSQFAELARTPLVLMLLCRACPGGDFPARRSDLYELCLWGLLRDWRTYDKEQVERRTCVRRTATYIDELIEVLEELALNFKRNRRRQSRVGDVRRAIDSILSSVRGNRLAHGCQREGVAPADLIERFGADGILVSNTTQELRFLHATFQEYLAARALAKRPDCIEETLKHVYDPAWNQVAVLLAGILEEPGMYIAALLRKNSEDVLCRPLLLAIQAYAETGPDRLPRRFCDGLTDEVVSSLLRGKPGFLADVALSVIQRLPEVVKRLVVEVRRKSPTARGAVDVLGKIGSEQAVPALVEALGSEDMGLRLLAAKALGKIGSQDAIPDLRQALQDEHKAVRRAAASALGGIGAEEAVESLVEVLRDGSNDRRVRESAARALGQIGSEKAISDLLEVLLRDKERYVRMSAARALGKVGSEKAVPELLQSLCGIDNGRWVRESAARALGEIGSEKGVQALREALRNRENGGCVRESAAEALGKIGSEDAIPDLCQALQDKDRGVRRAAALALGGIRSEEAVDALAKALNDVGNGRHVRESAAWALGQIGSEEAVRALLKVLPDTDSGRRVRESAAEALGMARSQDAVDALLQTLQDTNVGERIRESAARALGQIGSEKAVHVLCEATQDRDVGVRKAATWALGEIGSEEGIGALLGAIEGKSSLLDRTVFGALRRIQSDKAIAAPTQSPSYLWHHFHSLAASLDYLAGLCENPTVA